MQTGNLPFTGEHEHSVMYAIMNTDPEPVTETHPDIPQDVDHIIQKALAKKPEDRYQHIQGFLDDLNAVLQGLAPDKAGARSRRVQAAKLKTSIVFSLIAVSAVMIIFLGRLVIPNVFAKHVKIVVMFSHAVDRKHNCAKRPIVFLQVLVE